MTPDPADTLATPYLPTLLNLCFTAARSGHRLVAGPSQRPGLDLLPAGVTVTVDAVAATEIGWYAQTTARPAEAASELIDLGARVRAVIGHARAVLITDPAGFQNTVTLEVTRPPEGGSHQ
ncbi:hypothetical protein ACTD5D_09745 [Nocardia takedensis]|uniref:hypothetical protein n=1 Tax=Nocardia takedensis TaxID=259390 RepID=UPI003F75EAFE